MKAFFLFYLVLISINVSAQPNLLSYCNLTPSDSVFFKGINNGDEISVQDLIKAKKLFVLNSQSKITSFTFSWECEDCELVDWKIYGDSFSESDIPMISEIRPKSVVVIDCIVGRKNNKIIAFL